MADSFNFKSKICECSLLKMSAASELSPWSDFLGCVVDVKTNNNVKRTRTYVENRLNGSSCANPSNQFVHYENRRSYIEEYRRSSQKSVKWRKYNSPAYASRYNLQLPVRVERQNSGASVKRKTSDRDNNCPVESAEKLLDSSYFVSPKIALESSEDSALSYTDIQDYVADEPKEPRLLKPRALEINLTGRFVKRINSSRTVPTARAETASRRQPVEHVKLPVPQRPLLTCSYKLPTSLRSKANDKCGGQSARLRTASLPSRTPTNTTFTVPANAMPPNGHSPYLATLLKDKKSLLPNKNSKVDLYRKRQLQQLVEILGETTLTPYLRRLSIGQNNMARPIINTDSIDYNVVFGSKI